LNALKVALGLGFVIFIHELGHFLLAKWNGVKVEKFSIGFGPTLWGFRRAETEYVLAAVPLGGFVKMLGETPEDEEHRTTDPRAYHNKSVGARMAIISAGVIMNILFGIVCNAFLFTQPRIELSSRVGAVSAGSPAYVAGLKPGDEIVAIDGETDIGFGDLMRKVTLSGQGQVLNFLVKRRHEPRPVSLNIQPRREAEQDRPVIGVQPEYALRIEEFFPPAGMEKPPSYPWPDAKERPTTRDVIKAVGVAGEKPKPVADSDELQDLMASNPDKELVLQIERRRGESSVKTFDFRLPPNYFVDFGFRLNVSPIVAIRTGSPAEKAGFRVGDLIARVDGKDDFDPMRLPAECYQKRGKPVTFVVERKEGGNDSKDVTLTVTPDADPPQVDPISNQTLEVPGLGICYQVVPRVRSVVADSPAARAGIKPGDVINAMSIPAAATVAGEKKPEAKPHEFRFDTDPVWVQAFMYLQVHKPGTIKLNVNDSPKVVEIQPVRDPEWFNPTRGLFFPWKTKTVPPRDAAAAARAGLSKTYTDVLMIYTTLRGLYQGRIGTTNLSGPIGIARIAYDAADSSWTDLISFLGMMSVNLAVLNFLPIPPLDGGQMVFLLIEKVRGRPLPESVLISAIYIGLPLLLLVMVFVTYQDIFRLVKGLIP
jgi:regulator of sigma E protease